MSRDFLLYPSQVDEFVRLYAVVRLQSFNTVLWVVRLTFVDPQEGRYQASRGTGYFRYRQHAPIKGKLRSAFPRLWLLDYSDVAHGYPGSEHPCVRPSRESQLHLCTLNRAKPLTPYTVSLVITRKTLIWILSTMEGSEGAFFATLRAAETQILRCAARHCHPTLISSRRRHPHLQQHREWRPLQDTCMARRGCCISTRGWLAILPCMLPSVAA